MSQREELEAKRREEVAKYTEDLAKWDGKGDPPIEPESFKSEVFQAAKNPVSTQHFDRLEMQTESRVERRPAPTPAPVNYKKKYRGKETEMLVTFRVEELQEYAEDFLGRKLCAEEVELVKSDWAPEYAKEALISSLDDFIGECDFPSDEELEEMQEDEESDEE